MLKMKELLDSVAFIRGVNEHDIWRKLYALPYKNLLEVK
jgi:hypothetical protein